MAMMMRTVDEQDHHNDHDHDIQHREFSSQRGVVGPTNANHVIYDVALSAPTLHHPFHHNTTTTATHSYNINTAFKTPGGQDQMASSQEISMGFPFTSAQWKELERQAMIYKYMMASLPVPIDLLLPNHISTTSTNLASSPPNLRYINGKADMEPGRCKRTDGKKWRCSRDVAPNQKYCERHMNRGRPRSRKHVEQQQHLQDNNNKRAHQSQDHQGYNTSTNSKTKTSKCNSITSLASNENSTTIVSQTPFLGPNSSTSMSNYHNYPCVNTASPFESRNLELMMKTEQQNVVQMAASDPRWLHLVQTKMELSQNPNDDEEEEEEEGPFLNLNSYASFNGTGHGNQDRDCALFLYHGDDVVSEPPSRSFIDAWSQTTPKMAADHETRRTLINDNNNKTCSASSCQGNLSPSSLTLSMGHRVSSISGETAFEETLRVCNPICWVSPLAEVLRPSAASEPPSPFAGSSTVTATVMSSPSGVLQKTAMASLSDSSNCSSPGLASASMAKPEISLL